MASTIAWAGAAMFVSCCVCIQVNAADKLNLLPTPKSVKVLDGEMALTSSTRIVATDPKLKPLAEIFSRELLSLTQIKMAVFEGEPKAGDIVLKINPKLRADNDITAVQNRQVVKTRDYAHTIKVSDMCVVEGWDYRAVCEGTATLLQAVKAKDGKASLPKMEIKDWPFADYVGWMFDCARQDVPISALRSIVASMRFWKCRYLHLHLSDESAFMFPLKKWPEASKFNGAINNGDPGKVWDRAELIKLVEFADACGVTIVPELETPGHCGGYQAALGDKLGDCNLRMMDIANDSIYPNLEEIINDMCDVFQSTPFFHIGGDEIELDRLKAAPHTAKYLKDHNMPDLDHGGMDALLKQHVLRLNEFIKKNGKKTLFWGGFQGPPQVPALKDCIPYSWHSGARDAQDAGLTTITVPWEIRVPPEKWNIYSSNKDMLKRTDSVLGGCRVAWEQSAESYVNGCVYESAFRQEGTWAVDSTATADLAEMKAREKVCIERMRRIAAPVQFKAEGVITNAPSGFQGFEYKDALKVTLLADVPAGCTIHYTTDGAEPGVKTPQYTAPLNLTGGLRFRAAMFDKAGELVGGYTFAPKYYWKGFEQNLTTGKPVESSGGKNPKEMPENAADGWVNIDAFWGTTPAPQWWQVDLQGEYNLDRVRIFPYWDGNRYYQYTISVGTDTNHLVQVVDATKNTTPETDQGRMHEFAPTKGRYIRVNVLKNSDNRAVHLVEVRAYEAGKTVPLVVPPSTP
jgi:hexosaminidase